MIKWINHDFFFFYIQITQIHCIKKEIEPIQSTRSKSLCPTFCDKYRVLKHIKNDLKQEDILLSSCCFVKLNLLFVTKDKSLHKLNTFKTKTSKM